MKKNESKSHKSKIVENNYETTINKKKRKLERMQIQIQKRTRQKPNKLKQKKIKSNDLSEKAVNERA